MIVAINCDYIHLNGLTNAWQISKHSSGCICASLTCRPANRGGRPTLVCGVTVGLEPGGAKKGERRKCCHVEELQSFRVGPSFAAVILKHHSQSLRVFSVDPH